MFRTIAMFFFLSWIASAAPEPQLRHTADPNSYHYLELNQDGSRMLVGEDHRAFLWDLNKQRLIHTLKGFNFLLDMKFSPDGRSLVVSDSPRWIGCYDCGGDKLVKRWEFRDGSAFKTEGDAYRLQFSPNGKYLLTEGTVQGVGPHDPVVRVLDAASGKVLRAYPGWAAAFRGQIGSYAFAPDSQGFVRHFKGRLQYYALPSGHKTAEANARLQGAWLQPHPLGVLAAPSQTACLVYAVPSFKILGERLVSTEPEPAHPDGTLSWSREGGKLLIRDAQGGVVYQGGPQEYVAYWVRGAGFGLGKRPQEDEGFPQLRDAKGVQLNAEFISSSNVGGGAGWLETGYGRETSLFDLSTGASLLQIPFAYDVGVSGDGRRLAVVMKKGILLLDLTATLQKGQPVLP